MKARLNKIQCVCPHCARPVASRRNILCAFCGQRLPAELLFQGEEKERVERDLADAKKNLQKLNERDPWDDGSGASPV